MAPQPPSPRQYLEKRISDIGLIRTVCRRSWVAAALANGNETDVTPDDLIQDIALDYLEKQHTFDSERGKHSTFVGWRALAVINKYRRKIDPKKRIVSLSAIELDNEDLETTIISYPDTEQYLSSNDCTKIKWLMNQVEHFDSRWKAVIQSDIEETMSDHQLAKKLMMSRSNISLMRKESRLYMRILFRKMPLIEFPQKTKLSAKQRKSIAKKLGKWLEMRENDFEALAYLTANFSGTPHQKTPDDYKRHRKFVKEFIENAPYRKKFLELLQQEINPHE